MKRILELLLMCVICTAAYAQPPNVIVIMADDLGYNDLSCYGSERHRTPVLDKMASEGLRLTSYYAGASVCTPSRMGLLSGSYPARLGWEGGVISAGMRPNTGLSLGVVTIAESFRQAGYRTVISGKWHVGEGELLPMNQGFDDCFYIVSSNNINRDLYRNDQLIKEKFDNRFLSQVFTEEVVRQINVESSEPFFIYVPYTAPHFPAEAHPVWDGHSLNSDYGDVVEELDACVGQILDALKQRGIDEQTLVLFISDNGPEGLQRKFNSAHPFTGYKWQSLEGGTRVPAIIRWPGKVEPGRVSHAIVSAIDLYPTLAHICKVQIEIPEMAQKIDGLNIWGSITGDAPNQSRHELMYWHGKGKATAIRVDDWKLFFDRGEGDPELVNGVLLYHLSEDPGETTDVSSQHPDKVSDLLKRAKMNLADIRKHSLPIGKAAQK